MMVMLMIRKPCVNGLFYAGDSENLRGNIESFFDSIDEPVTNINDVVAGVVPHAGYVYSGRTASFTFSALKDNLPDTFIVIGPNHTGRGSDIDLCSSKQWETPLGLVDVDVDFVEELLNVEENACIDDNAHVREHSIEVEIPFIQYICEDHDFKIVPIVISKQIPELCESLAGSIKKVSEKLGKKIVVLASSDLNHYEDSETSKFLDDKVMKSVGNMDTKQLVNDIVEYDITMCGYGPVITAICYAKLCNYDSCDVLNYSNSGDVSGDYDSVVGYMSAIIGR